MNKEVVKLLKKSLKEIDVNLKDEEIEKLIEIPPSSELGDYAFPCFFLAERLKMSPHEIALEVRENIPDFPETEFDDIQTQGPYVNFFVNKGGLARQVVWDIISQKKKYGSLDIGNGKKVVVEFSSPNIAKPFHIGHLRSTIIGNSIANILEFTGHKVVRLNYLGDWGTQFGKLLFGFQKWGNEKTFEKDPLNYLLKIYIKANGKKYEKSAREWFKKMEDGDRKALILWKLFKGFTMDDFKKIYKTLGIIFDAYEAESQYNKKAKEVLQELKDKKIAVKSKGAYIINLEYHGLGTVVIEKSDGTTIYLARDLAAAIDRQKRYKFDRMIYEVGQEQKMYFRQLFKILELLGFKWAKNCIHVDHGLYLDSKGKKFSTRKGKTVFLKDILNETTELAKREIKKKDTKISKKVLDERALKIAIAAIFYGDLKSNRANNTTFDLKKFVSFDGDTGSYIAYSYARASSIINKIDVKEKFQITELEEKEFDLVKKLSQFPEVVLSAQKSLNPSVIANYSYQLAQTFNEFYHVCHVLGSQQETFRLALVQAFRQTLKNAMSLLGIELLEKM
ncbi:MAG: arginine--tRNA ligase [Candidatus Pacearchaeota archaeon]